MHCRAMISKVSADYYFPANNFASKIIDKEAL